MGSHPREDLSLSYRKEGCHYGCTKGSHKGCCFETKLNIKNRFKLRFKHIKKVSYTYF